MKSGDTVKEWNVADYEVGNILNELTQEIKSRQIKNEEFTDDISLKNFISSNVRKETKNKLSYDEIFKIPLAVTNDCGVAKDIDLLYSLRNFNMR